jgi:hypothetical protein
MIAARALWDEQRRSAALLLTPSFYVLTSYAFELSFKSVVRHMGASEKKIRALGHNLDAGLIAATAGGYVPPPNLRLPELVSMLSKHHMDSSMRYLLGDEPVVGPRPDDVLRCLECHLRAIDQQLAVLRR